MKLLYIVALGFLFACNNGKNEKIDELNKKVDELTAQQKEAQQQKEKEAAEAKAKEVQGNKDLIIEQIKKGKGLVITPDLKPVGVGGISGKFTIENALSGIVFQVIKVQSTVFLSNGEVFGVPQTYTFTNLKPGDSRPREISSTGNKGTKCEIKVIEIQSNWLTNGKLMTL